MKMGESKAVVMKQTVADMLKGIDRYNPNNLKTLERYVVVQSQENTYDLEANLAVLKLYQFNQAYDLEIISQILLKALTNLPHTDIVLCKCLLNEELCKTSPVDEIIFLADLLESCNLSLFWKRVSEMPELFIRITGFHDSIRKFVCHVVSITFQMIQKPILAQLLGGIDDQTLKFWVQKYGWKEEPNDMVLIANQDENIKTKNITEKIDFDSVAVIMATCR